MRPPERHRDLNNEVFSVVSTDGPPVVGHYDISDTDSNQESLSVTVERVCLRRTTVITHERLKTHRDQDMGANSGAVRVQHLCSLSAGQLQTQCITLKMSTFSGKTYCIIR